MILQLIQPQRSATLILYGNKSSLRGTKPKNTTSTVPYISPSSVIHTLTGPPGFQQSGCDRLQYMSRCTETLIYIQHKF